MSAVIDIQDVSVKFNMRSRRSGGLKEAVMNLIHSPKWSKDKPNPEILWGLRDISLSLRDGDRLGILGKNGAGKSTLLKVISRIYKPSEGRLTVQGRIASLIEIGGGFNPELSGRENIFLNGAILGIPRKTIQARENSIIEFSELGDFIDMPLKYYSTGMHLRLAFTIATEIPPEILILDELYAGGDASFIQKANARLRAFVDQSKILILVSHDPHYLRQFCNRAIVLDHGRILGAGDTDEMIDKYLSFCAGNTTAFQTKPELTH